MRDSLRGWGTHRRVLLWVGVLCCVSSWCRRPAAVCVSALAVAFLRLGSERWPASSFSSWSGLVQRSIHRAGEEQTTLGTATLRDKEGKVDRNSLVDGVWKRKLADPGHATRETVMSACERVSERKSRATAQPQHSARQITAINPHSPTVPLHCCARHVMRACAILPPQFQKHDCDVSLVCSSIVYAVGACASRCQRSWRGRSVQSQPPGPLCASLSARSSHSGCRRVPFCVSQIPVGFDRGRQPGGRIPRGDVWSQRTTDKRTCPQ